MGLMDIVKKLLTVSTTIRIVDSTRINFSTNATPFMIFLYTFIRFLPFPVCACFAAGFVSCQVVLPVFLHKKSRPTITRDGPYFFRKPPLSLL